MQNWVRVFETAIGALLLGEPRESAEDNVVADVNHRFSLAENAQDESSQPANRECEYELLGDRLRIHFKDITPERIFMLCLVGMITIVTE